MDQPTDGRHPAKTFIAALTVLLITAGALLIWSGTKLGRRHHPPTPATANLTAATQPAESPAPAWTPSEPAIPDDTETWWAHLDSTEGTITEDNSRTPIPLDELIIPGLAADYLNTLTERDQMPTPHDSATLYAALTGSAQAAEQLTSDAGGVDASFGRVVDACSLTQTTMDPPRATVLDIARYGACLREGAIVNPDLSAWVLDQMRNTIGGIGDVRGNDGGQRLAQFNSTTDADVGRKRTSCLGVGAYWSAAVVVDWPAERGEMFGVAVCAEVARAKFPPDTQQAPESMPAPAATISS